MGGVASVPVKSRAELAMLAMQQEEAFANAQRTYSDLQEAMAKTITEFVTMHCLLSSDPVKLQDTKSEETKEVPQDSSIVIEKVETPRIEDYTSGKNKKTGRQGKKSDGGATKKYAEMAGEEAETSARQEDNDAPRPPESLGNMGLSEALEQIKFQSEEIKNSSTVIYKLLETAVQVQEPKNIFIRSFTRSRSTRITSFSRSHSSKVGDDGGEKAEAAKHPSTLQRLYASEKTLSLLLKNLRTTGGEVDKQCAGEDALDAFDKIKRLRDHELQTLLSNLIKSMHANWKKMSEGHDKQEKIFQQCEKKIQLKPHDQMCWDAEYVIATVELQTRLQNWKGAFTSYISSQKNYVKSLHDWSRSSPPSIFGNVEDDNGCKELLGDWSARLEQLDARQVTAAMSTFDGLVTNLRNQQKKQLACRSKVNKLNDKLVQEAETSSKKKNKMPRQEKEEEESKAAKNKKKNKNKKTRQEKKEDGLRDYEKRKTETQEFVEKVIKGFAPVFKSLKEFTTTAAQKYAEVTVE